MPTPLTLARIQAVGRIAAGTALAFAPERSATGWVGGSDAGRTGTQVMTAAMGARDLAIGLGQARAVGAGTGIRQWLAAGILADGVDLVATLRARDELTLPAVAGIGAIAGGSVLLGLYLQRELD